MSRIVLLIIAAGLVILAAAAININRVDARQQPEFLQISVLAEHEADYGVNEQTIAIPAVSVEIIADAAQDFQTQSSVQIITYTSLPAKDQKSDSEKNENTASSVDETKHNYGQGNGNHGNQANNGNDGSHPNGANENGNQTQNSNGSVNDRGIDNSKNRERESRTKKGK